MNEKERLLRVRAREKREFKRYDAHKKKKLDNRWRRPRGLHNKLRRHIRAKGRYVQAGFGSPRLVRGLHASGLREVLVTSPAGLDGLDPSECAIRIGSTVGRKKRLIIQERAAELGLKVLNPLKLEEQKES
ncbi:MAG TPA: 50S ribosomal protein L32e [Candidatus Syntrophoarchaeum butanivorans]|uniref:Large ribosomal subunit protein eL32 n=1 Tax=Candidatus Syntropharchaeum butanivorans TaxID=1839936 RepID=A0A1F2P4J5_9EURY|nr:MAG: Ribosomal protein L32e [Candidatus Syntrophoarchaeum butanivorans]HEC57307.1 50S ribosomal protein L32e [Candidatus Syntrophoarchaeum butanivorans]